MWIRVGYYWGWVILCKIKEVSSRVNVAQWSNSAGHV